MRERPVYCAKRRQAVQNPNESRTALLFWVAGIDGVMRPKPPAGSQSRSALAGGGGGDRLGQATEPWTRLGVKVSTCHEEESLVVAILGWWS